MDGQVRRQHSHLLVTFYFSMKQIEEHFQTSLKPLESFLPIIL